MNDGQKVINDTLQEIQKSPTGKSPGVYRMLSENDELLYVGKAKILENRLKNYLQPQNLSNRISRMVFLTRKVEIITTKTESEALILEANLIYNLQPKFNILLKDDKTYPYIHIRKDHDFPQIVKYRGKKINKKDYFGPFASASAVAEVVSYLQKIFFLRPCSDSFFENRSRPCLQYQIKRCSAPCVGKIDKTNYATLVAQAENFLKGNNVSLQNELSKLMEAASQNMEYEKAATHRDQIRALTQIQAKTELIASGEINNADAFAIAKELSTSCIQVFFIRNGQNYGNQDFFPKHSPEDSPAEIIKSFLLQFYQNRIPPKEIFLNLEINETEITADALAKDLPYKIKIISPKIGAKARFLDFIYENAVKTMQQKQKKVNYNQAIFTEIKNIFNLPTELNKIEIYDNSHISGTNAVGAMVAAGTEGFLKKDYRKFNIQTTQIGDDYQMMREMLSRRLKKLNSSNFDQWPNLIIIDGGKGHLQAVLSIVPEHFFNHIKFISIAKSKKRNEGNETFFIHNHKNKQITKLNLSNENSVMKYLQILRDESHKYAITSHRQKRSKNLTSSDLNNIPGIGKKRRTALLNHFASLQDIKTASIDQLTQVPLINQTTAQQIHNFFHQ